MKVLHTGDWHVGRNLYRVSRLDEVRATLAEISELAASEQVDAIVVCGDVFEHLSPSPEAEQVVYEALESFCRQDISVVLISGNHDHPGRWRALAPLFRRFNIHVVDDLLPPEGGGIVEITSRDGRETLQVACLPWVSERRLYEAADMMNSGGEMHKSYAEGMGNAIQRLCAGFEPGKCHLLAAHIFISGTEPSGSERALVMGEIYAITPNALSTSGAEYAALGHVHKPQKGPGVSIPCRYAGSLLQLDFGEIEQQKGVCIVELAPGLPAHVREVPLQTGRRLEDIHCTLQELEGHRELDGSTYARVVLKCDGPQAGLSDRVRELLPNALVVKLEYPDRAQEETLDLRSRSPRELFDAYLGDRTSPEILDAFDALMSSVSAS